MFSVLGSLKCKELSVLDLKTPFTHLDYQKAQKCIVEYFHTLLVYHICTKECPWD